MKIPSEVPVMVLTNAILFPGALLPLYIFEPRYRRMLSDCLHTHRVFAIAMKKPACKREIPSTVAGLGLIRAAVTREDGSSYLILQGLLRIELDRLIQRQPYRSYRIRVLQSEPNKAEALTPLTEKLKKLITQRLRHEHAMPPPLIETFISPLSTELVDSLMVYSLKHFIKYLSQLQDPGQVADLVSCTMLSNAVQRQIVLETVDLEQRLQRVIRFISEDLRVRKRDQIP